MMNKSYVVAHKKQYLRVGEKLQHVKQGTEVKLDEKIGARLCKKGALKLKSEADAISVGSNTNKHQGK